MKNPKLIINIGVSVLILIVIFTQIPLSQIVQLLQSCRLDLFALSVLVAGFSIILNAQRWKILLKPLGYAYDFFLINNLSFITFFFNTYLPGGVAGEVARTALLPERKSAHEDGTSHLMKVTASVITDKIVGLLGIMILAGIGFLLNIKLLADTEVKGIFLITCLAIVILFVVLYSRRTQKLIKRLLAVPLKALPSFKEPIKKVLESVGIYRDKYSEFFFSLVLSVLGHVTVVVYFYLQAESLGVEIGFLKLLAFVPIIEFVAMMPISLGGIGVREATTILLFSSDGVPAAQALSVSLLSFGATLLVGAVGGIIYFFWCKEKSKVKILSSSES